MILKQIVSKSKTVIIDSDVQQLLTTNMSNAGAKSAVKQSSATSPQSSLTISELEAITGFTRTAIRFYIRRGLLPPPQKPGRTVAYYGEEHVARLALIRQLKTQGIRLSAMERDLAEAFPPRPATNDTDYAAERALTVRNQILEVATRAFATKGYTRTRIVDICNELGIAPVTLYRHFPTKRRLFLEVVAVFASESYQYIEPLIANEPEYVRRSMMRTAGWIGLRALSPDMLTYVRAESLGNDPELQHLIRDMYSELLEPIAADIEKLRGSMEVECALPQGELIAYAIQGVEEALVMRLSWDERYSLTDYFSTMLLVFLAIEAIYTRKIDLSEERAQYSSLVGQLAELPPLTPPSIERGSPQPGPTSL